MIDTPTLIRRLAADSRSRQPLARPWARTLAWVAISMMSLLGSLLGFAVVWPHPPIGTLLDVRFLIEQAAAMATGIAAATAAFASVVPGSSRRVALLIVIPLAIWLGVLGQSCVQDWSDSGQSASLLRLHWACVPATLLAGAVPAIALILMLRRGAPMTPFLTMALAGVAVAGLANVLMRVVHASDASLVVLAWHVLAVFGVSAASTAWSRWVFSWRHLQASHGVRR
jgi:hypothetical protein